MSSTKTKLKLFLLANLFLLLAVNFVPMKPAVILSLALVFYILIFAFIDQKISLYLIIFFRPCLDIFTNNEIISVFDVKLNIASIIGAVSLILAVILIYKNKDEKPPLLKIWLIFLSINILSLFYTFDRLLSLKEIIRLSSVFFIYLSSFYVIKQNKDFVILVKVIIFSALIPGILAIYQYITHAGITIPFENIYNRIFGTFAHPNLFAYYLIIPITLAILIFLIGKKEKLVNTIIFVTSFVFIILLGLTYTRGAWLALALIIFVVGVLKYRILLINAIVIIFILYIFVEPINTRVNDISTKRQGNSIEWRKNLWQDTLGYIAKKPIFGYGTGTANEVILEERGEKMGSPDPHNDYIKITIENGIVGLTSYLLLVFSTLFILLKKYLQNTKDKLKTINLIAFTLYLTLLMMSFADNILRNTALQWTLWSLIGALMGIDYYKKQKKDNENMLDK